MNDRRTLLLLGVLLVAVSLTALVQLFRLRFQAGDVYPAYSSLRADPLGTKVLYEALGRMPGIEVERRTSFAHGPAPDSAETILYLGWRASAGLPEGELAALKRLAASGNRVLFALAGARPEEEEKAEEAPSPSPTPDQTATPADGTPLGSAFDFELVPLPAASEREAIPDLPNLPGPVPWHGNAAFEPGAPWRVLYRAEELPVVMERALGDGSLVLVSQSYLFSNEAMKSERQTALVTALLGRPRVIVFDETHFGVVLNPGLSDLIRRYGLVPATLVLLLAGILFVWRNAFPLVPRPSSPPRRESPSLLGKDADEARVHLLRRSISRHDLIPFCMKWWHENCQSLASRRPDLTATAERIAADSATARRKPLDTYRTIAQTLSQHRS